MNDKIFLDTNILVYSYSNNEIDKQAIARKLISENNANISTQVLQEFVNIITKKFKYTFSESEIALDEICANNILFTNTESTIKKACEVAERYRFSFYDSLIISAALQCSCTTLYSEDMNHNQTIDSKLSIINPFILM